MISAMLSILLIPFLAAMFLAINMGGSGTSPSFSAAYGANIIRKDLIPGLFGLFVFCGAIFAGKKVVLTISKDVLPGEAMTLVLTTIILLSVSISLLIANLLGVTQSTSQSTVFALIGPGFYFNILKGEKLLFEIIPIWFILPIIAFCITLFLGRFLYVNKKLLNFINFKQISQNRFLKGVVILAACYVAFAIGSNNVANAAGPIASMVLKELSISGNESSFLLIMILSTLLVAPCFGIGSSIFGDKLVQTTGKEIIEFGPLGATLISVVTASLLLLASVTRGIPTSLVQLNTGAIIGLGIAKIGWKEIVVGTAFKKILAIWIIAPFIAFILSIVLTVIADYVGLLQ